MIRVTKHSPLEINNFSIAMEPGKCIEKDIREESGLVTKMVECKQCVEGCEGKEQEQGQDGWGRGSSWSHGERLQHEVSSGQ